MRKAVLLSELQKNIGNNVSARARARARVCVCVCVCVCV